MPMFDVYNNPWISSDHLGCKIYPGWNITRYGGQLILGGIVNPTQDIINALNNLASIASLLEDTNNNNTAITHYEHLWTHWHAIACDKVRRELIKQRLQSQVKVSPSSFSNPKRSLLYCLKKLRKGIVKNSSAYIYVWLNNHLKAYNRRGKPISLVLDKLKKITGYKWQYAGGLTKIFLPQKLCKSYYNEDHIVWLQAKSWKELLEDKRIFWDHKYKIWVSTNTVIAYYTLTPTGKTKINRLNLHQFSRDFYNANITCCPECGYYWEAQYMVLPSSSPVSRVCPTCNKRYFSPKALQQKQNTKNKPHTLDTIYQHYHARKNSWIFKEKRFNGLDNDLPLGIELEMQYKYPMKVPHKTLWGITCKWKAFTGKKEPDYYFETDGSLNSGGVEMVTNPMTLYKQKEFWSWWLPELIKHFVGWNILKVIPNNLATYGIHLTFNRQYWDGLPLARLLKFFNTKENEAFIQTVSQRSYTYNSREPISSKTKKLSEIVLLNGKKIGYSPSKYAPINIKGNSNLVEIRVFRSTLNPRSFMKNIEFIDALHKWMHATPFSVDYKDFLEWLFKNYETSERYKNLLNFIFIHWPTLPFKEFRPTNKLVDNPTISTLITQYEPQ